MNDVKYYENETQIIKYNTQIKKINRKHNILNKFDNLINVITIISGLSVFVISPVALIPFMASLGGSHLVHKKQANYNIELSDLSAERGILQAQNYKYILSLEENVSEKKSNSYEYPQNKMTTGLYHKPLVKTKVSK